MENDVARAHFFLKGEVQGVGMRFYIRSLAEKYALHGFVRNLPDGRVESILEGPRTKIENVIEEIKSQEYAHYVKGMECQWENPTHQFQKFEIQL